jgi:hypothetical protein
LQSTVIKSGKYKDTITSLLMWWWKAEVWSAKTF